MWLGSSGRHDLPCLHAPRLTPAFTRWALGAGGPSARLLARCPRRLYSELPGCEVRPRGSDNHCRVNTSSISVESISVNPGLAPSPAPSLAAGLRTYPLALGSVPRILGMGKWFWFPDPFGPGTVPFLLTTFPQGLGASGGMPVLVGDDTRPQSDAPPGGPGPGPGTHVAGRLRSAWLGGLLPSGALPMAEHPGALLAATPSTETKRNGGAWGRQRCAWHQFIVYKP